MVLAVGFDYSRTEGGVGGGRLLRDLPTSSAPKATSPGRPSTKHIIQLSSVGVCQDDSGAIPLKYQSYYPSGDFQRKYTLKHRTPDEWKPSSTPWVAMGGFRV